MRLIRLSFQNRDESILVTPDQFKAVMERDMISARRSGLSFDDYMSFIDPDYPA